MLELNSVEQAITHWDGKSTSDIGEVYTRFCDESGFVNTIIALASAEKLQKGATWLLKRHLEVAGGRKGEHCSEILGLLPQLARNNWEAKLHLLQCMPYLVIEVKDKQRVERFLRQCLMNSNKFVRAWSYHGFYELSMQFPEYTKETKQFFEMAKKDEAPSVLARIRKIEKLGF